MRDWYWQVQALGQGPDAVFSAGVQPPAGLDLASLVRTLMPPGFAPEPGHCAADHGGADEQVYVDRHTHERMLAMDAAGVRENLYHYGRIVVSPGRLHMENVLMGHHPAQTELLVALANVPGVVVEDWQIGHAGYSHGEVARGLGGPALMAYLAHGD